MASGNKKEKNHVCPPIPFKDNLPVPGWYGQPFEAARSAWFAHLRRVQKLVPMPRTTR